VVTDRYTNWLLSLIFAFIYIYIIPWIELYGGDFVDIHSYITRIVYLHDGRPEAEYFGLKWLISEPLWKAMLIAFGNMFTDYRAVLYGVSFVTVFIYVSFLIKRVEFYIAMIFLLNPMMVDLFIAQLRSVFAFSIVLLAYNLYENNKDAKILTVVLLIMATLIHMSMPIFYAIYYLMYRLNHKVEDYKYYFFAIVTGLIIALFMKYGSNLILTMIGDRHAGYDEYIASASIAYSISWFIITLILATFGDFSDREKRVAVAYAITFMAFFFFASVLNIFAARYVAIIMPFIILSISYLPKHIKQGTYLFLVVYNIYSFKYWLSLVIL